MYSGDADGNGTVNASDKAIWSAASGKQGYHGGDFDLNSQVDNTDKNDRWLVNLNKASTIPE
jgi:hypothetical protein